MTGATDGSRAELDDILRQCVPFVLTALVHRYGDFATAEDATQEALLAAARQWPESGMPDEPRSWLIRVASRRYVDHVRSDRARRVREMRTALAMPQDAWTAPAADAPGFDERDDSLVLLLLCCHPALRLPSQVALTLRAVAGLSTVQIARAFLLPESTMAQRISRAKSRLKEVGARFGAPDAGELCGRVDAVEAVLYLIFTEGHTSSAGPSLLDVCLSAEAIRLTRQLHERLPHDGEVTGLLALMLLTDGRRAARIRADGSLVPLAEQDRQLWNRAYLAEGLALVEAVLPSGPVGPYQLQAAIAAVHAEARTAGETDWLQIETLYTMLYQLTPSPIVALNHAVAIAEAFGPGLGLERLRPLLDDHKLRHHHRLHAVRAHLLELDGQFAEARAAYAAAARFATSIPEQRYLNDKVSSVRSERTVALPPVRPEPRRRTQVQGEIDSGGRSVQ